MSAVPPVQEPLQGASEPMDAAAASSEPDSNVILVPSSQGEEMKKSDAEQEQPKMDVDESEPKATEEIVKNAEVESVLQRITPETLEALKKRDLEIAELRSRMERLTELIENMMSSCETYGHEVLLADNELIVSLEREVELRNRTVSRTNSGNIA